MNYIKNIIDTLRGKQLVEITIVILILLLSVIVGKIIKFVLTKASNKAGHKNKKLLKLTLFLLSKVVIISTLAIGLKIAVNFLPVSPNLLQTIMIGANVFIVMVIGYVLYWLAEVPSFWLSGLAKQTENRLDDMLVPIVRKTLRVIIISLVAVQIAQMLSDKPVTSILAGLGIGGLAVALAAQDTIKNFFGSIVLFIDRPFELGDLVCVDGQTGVVEEVGFRSTRVRTLNGHLVTIPNGDFANKTIENIEKRPYIKKVIDLGLTYDTSPEKIEEAMKVLKDILHNHKGMHPDLPAKIFFDEFGSFYLNIKVFFWYHPGKYWEFMDFLSELNAKILKEFNSRGIEFAFPTQTLFMAGDNNRPIKNIQIEQR